MPHAPEALICAEYGAPRPPCGSWAACGGARPVSGLSAMPWGSELLVLQRFASGHAIKFRTHIGHAARDHEATGVGARGGRSEHAHHAAGLQMACTCCMTFGGLCGSAAPGCCIGHGTQRSVLCGGQREVMERHAGCGPCGRCAGGQRRLAAPWPRGCHGIPSTVHGGLQPPRQRMQRVREGREEGQRSNSHVRTPKVGGEHRQDCEECARAQG